MSMEELRAPLPVIATTRKWRRSDGTHVPAVRIVGTRGTVFVGPDDLEQLARAVADALTAKHALARTEQQGREVTA